MDNIESYRKALTHDCPACGASAGKACWWIRGDAAGLLFHAGRLPAEHAYAAEELEAKKLLEALRGGTPEHEPTKDEFDAAVLNTGLL